MIIDQGKKRAVVLLSGGLDSATAAAAAKEKGFELYALTILYGQRHACEVDAAKRTAKSLGVREHKVLDLPFEKLVESNSSTLFSASEKAVPKDRSDNEMSTGIPSTYVPARNTLFLSLALAWAEVLKAKAIFIGVNAVDYSGYPDCRPEFISAFQNLAAVATKEAVEKKSFPKIETPLIKLTKAEIIKLGNSLGVNFSLTHSCYSPDEKGIACGQCDSCLLRLKGFKEAGLKDPVRYEVPKLRSDK